MMISEREKGLAFSSTFTMRKAEECNGVSGAAVPLQVPKNEHELCFTAVTWPKGVLWET